VKFEFTEEQNMMIETVKGFAQKEVAPIAAEIDETMEFPWKTIRKMGELGLLGIPYPEEYGGSGFDNLSYMLAVEELGKVCASHAITMAAHISIGSGPIYMFGNEEQKRKYFVPLAKGEKLAAFCMTEPGAGSDAGSTKTTAVKDGDYYIINGTKNFATNGGVADVFVVTAVTDKEKGVKGISNFILEKGMKGLILGKKENKMGWRASDTRQLAFEDLRVPKENIIGEEGQGFKQFMKALEGGRISVAALSLGLAEAAFEASRKYASERKQFDQTIDSFQAIQFMLSDMAVGIEAGRHLTYHAAMLKDQGKPFAKEGAIAKLFCSEMAMNVTTKAVQVHGGYGYIKDYPVERYMRDAKVCEIGEGTSEIQRIVIFRHLKNEAQ